MFLGNRKHQAGLRSSSQVLQFTFSVANTDQVTPIFWNVELIQ